ncbi:hypothetical protein [Deinococcus irradiatisoli]|uniref:hypothetical protein n=1 Tax=Deinococcus irradiatisoli TaxID=2202254 RepID=UPI0011B2570B|nr:hypothetical protein [Deinococcus irradiatisoli]
MNAIDASYALDLLSSGQPLEGIHMDALDLHSLADDNKTEVHVPITVRDSRIDALDSSSLVFHRPLLFDDAISAPRFAGPPIFALGRSLSSVHSMARSRLSAVGTMNHLQRSFCTPVRSSISSTSSTAGTQALYTSAAVTSQRDRTSSETLINHS